MPAEELHNNSQMTVDIADGIYTAGSTVGKAALTSAQLADLLAKQFSEATQQKTIPAKPDGLERLDAQFSPASSNDDDRTIDVIWYTGAKVPRMDWWTGDSYNLTLSMEPGACRLDRLNNGAPILDSHMGFSTSEQLGVVRKAWLEANLGKATIQFSKRDDVTPLWNDIKAGIVQKLSVGTAIYQKKDITQKGDPTTEIMAIDWEPFEISVVSVPADAKTAFLSAHLADVNARTTERASAQHKGEPVMADKTTQDAGEVARNNEAQLAQAREEASKTATTEATKVERERISQIRLVAAPFGKQIEEKFIMDLVDRGVSLVDARSQILEELAKKSAAEPINPTAAVTRDKRETFRQQMEAALFLRGNPQAPKEIQELGREFTGLTLLEMARECLFVCGVKTRGWSRDQVAKVALEGNHGSAEYFAGMETTSDLPYILANVANKTLRQAYQAAPRTFTPFSRQTTAADFKPLNRVQLSDIAALHAVNEMGEFHRTYVSDGKEVLQLATYGDIVPITRRVVINDDLQALTRIPAGLGVAAATMESNTVWAIFTANAAMNDTIALFHASHSNLVTTNALAAVANFTASRAAMRLQTAPKGTILNLVPRYLIVPAALEGTAFQFVNPTNLAATDGTKVVPAFIQSMIPIVEPRLDANSTTTWYVAADPSMIDTIEYCYLEGQEGVYIETRYGFEVDGVEIKARLDFAAAPIDYRGLQKNTA